MWVRERERERRALLCGPSSILIEDIGHWSSQNRAPIQNSLRLEEPTCKLQFYGIKCTINAYLCGSCFCLSCTILFPLYEIKNLNYMIWWTYYFEFISFPVFLWLIWQSVAPPPLFWVCNSCCQSNIQIKPTGHIKD